MTDGKKYMAKSTQAILTNNYFFGIRNAYEWIKDIYKPIVSSFLTNKVLKSSTFKPCDTLTIQ